MGCEEVQRLLDERAMACRGELERLSAEAERIAELIVRREAELVRLDTARQVVVELPAAHAAVAGVQVPPPRADPGAAAAARGREAAVFTEKVWHVLEAFVSNTGTPVRCRDVVEALGQEVAPRRVEKVRHHLKRLVAAGRVVQAGPGLFTPAGQRDAALG